MSDARRDDWKQLINAAMLGRQRDVLRGRTLDATINVFEVTCGHIPSERFAATLKRSFALTDRHGAPLFWDASAFGLAYSQLLDEGAFSPRPPAVDQPDAKTCTFCDEERMCKIWVPGGDLYVTAPCRDCRPKAFEQYMQNWHKENGQKQEPVSLAIVEKVKDKLTMLCDSCAEKVVEAYPQERPCKRWLNMAEGSEKAPELCEGTLRKAHRAECMNQACEHFKITRLVIVGHACICGSEMQTV